MAKGKRRSDPDIALELFTETISRKEHDTCLLLQLLTELSGIHWLSISTELDKRRCACHRLDPGTVFIMFDDESF